MRKILKEKEKELRKDSIRVYSSFINIFKKWITDFGNVEYFSMINRLHVVRFMDYIYENRNVSARSYNNYVKFGRAVFNWAKEKCFTKENPFELIKTKPKTEKKRIIIQNNVRKTIANYLISEPDKKNYLIVLKLIYSSLLRPAEIQKIKVENIDMQNKIIIVPNDVSKNKKQRIVSLTDDVLSSLETLNLHNFPKSYYVFGKGLVPDNL